MPFSPASVSDYLDDVRKGIDSGKFIPVCRRKNMITLSRLGILWEDAKEEIYNLTPGDYFQGPEIDRDDPSSDYFWMFKKVVLGHLLYIKIKVLYQTDNSVKAVSFHIDGM